MGDAKLELFCRLPGCRRRRMECTREHQLSLYRPIIPVSAPNEAGYGLSHMKKKKDWIRKYTVDRFRSDPDLCLNPVWAKRRRGRGIITSSAHFGFSRLALDPGFWMVWLGLVGRKISSVHS
jgi:hypothetical protein